MQNIIVKHIVIGKQFENSENFKKLIKIVEEKKIKVTVAESGDRINIEKDIYFDVLWPNSDSIINENILNNNSLVCKLVYRDFCILFTGDIEEIAEKAILKTYKDNLNILKANIVKVAHHRF